MPPRRCADFSKVAMDDEMASVADVIEKAIKEASDIRPKNADAQNAEIARLQELIASSPAVIYSYEAKGSFWPTFVGPNIKTLLGYEPDEYLTHPDFWLRCVHPDD